MTEAVSDRGYVKTTVADVIARAGVSRATFYAQFSDKDDCFRAAFAMVADLVALVLEDELATIRRTAGEVAPIDQLDRLFATYLRLLGDAPALAKTFLIEVYAAGPAVIEQRRVSLERFVDLVAETHRGCTGLLGTEPSQRLAAQVLVGAVASMVTNLIGVGDEAHLVDLHDPLMQLVRQLVGADGLS